MKFKKYQHIDRYGNSACENIEIGKTYIFPKIDGTNASVYLSDNGEIKAGSRTRELTLEKDNVEFYAYVLGNENIKRYLESNPTHRLYGEFLVPHSLKTYNENAWRKFYIFDVCIDNDDDSVNYIPYNDYKPLLENYGLDYIPPIMEIKNGSYDNFIKTLDKNLFLIEDGKGYGEGIVIKNYDYKNKYGRIVWAKIVTNEFKEKHSKAMGSPFIENKMIEQQIIDKFCTVSFIEKEYSKIVCENDGWSSKFIPMLLNKIFNEMIQEEMWNILKVFKNPKIDFKILNSLVTMKIKEVKKDIF